MSRWVFPYGIWYAAAVLCALGAAADAASGNVLGATLIGVYAAGAGVLAVRSRVRWSRSGEKKARAEMMRLVDQRTGSGVVAWLDRDARLLFSPGCRRVMGLRARTLMVIDEDLQRDVEDARDAGGGKSR